MFNEKFGAGTVPGCKCGLGDVYPDHIYILSSLNEMGVKGAGEAAAIPVGSLFAQVLEDALHDMDFEILEIPLNSNRLWELTNASLQENA